jgi:hypothetical protein
LVFYITHASTRYRHPMDPVMLILAVYGLAYPVTYLLRRSSSHNSIPAAEKGLRGDPERKAIHAG